MHMRKCGLCRPAVSGWVRGWVSVTFVYCVETAKDTAIVAVECQDELYRMVQFSSWCDLEIGVRVVQGR